jgi:hypothetical protein
LDCEWGKTCLQRLDTIYINHTSEKSTSVLGIILHTGERVHSRPIGGDFTRQIENSAWSPETFKTPAGREMSLAPRFSRLLRLAAVTERFLLSHSIARLRGKLRTIRDANTYKTVVPYPKATIFDNNTRPPYARPTHQPDTMDPTMGIHRSLILFGCSRYKKPNE